MATPKGAPLAPPSVYLRCRRSSRWVGDVLWRPPGETFWLGSRYHVLLSDDACGDHAHVPPSEAEVAAKVAETEGAHVPVALHVGVRR
jgi:hypothetical protein